ncbi:MAG: aminotransferase class I/II-fold pyridoxal phosphate-dependent enzyme, partial [Oscillospiraceae bacterium]|nr:aminotransferase class I/II-fold pyridoxal phosphate-dependent enzyme [Oscillospiraceae bacterium]
MTRERAQQLAEELVGRMTVEEKAGQLRFDAPAIERLGIPAYNWWNEGLHGLACGGTATSFPQAIGMAAMFDEELLEKIASVCVRKDILVISDEIYSELTYAGEHTSIASLPGMRERTVYISGFSKAFAMTGWR